LQITSSIELRSREISGRNVEGMGDEKELDPWSKRRKRLKIFVRDFSFDHHVIRFVSHYYLDDQSTS